MKVLFVMEDSVPIENGCPVRNRYIMENLKKMGLEIVGLTSPFMRVLPGQITEGSEVINGIRYYRSQYLNTISNVSSLILRWKIRAEMYRKYCQLLERICMQEKPDIIHAITSYVNGNAANKVGMKLNIPRLYEIRSIAGATAAVVDGKSHSSFKYQAVWKLDKRAMMGATRVAPLSKVLKNELKIRGVPEGIMDAVDNGGDTDEFIPLERSREIAEKYSLGDSTIIGYIGSIRKIEGLYIAVQAAPKILEQCPDTKFMFIGAGDDVENLKGMSRKLGVEYACVFPGKIPRNEILKYYSIIDIFTVPRVDALVNQTITPLKPLEAMAMERALLVSNVGGLAELVQNGKTGVMFEADNVESFTEKCIDMIRNKEKRITLGKEARKWVVEYRQWKDMAKQYLPIYDKILKR